MSDMRDEAVRARRVRRCRIGCDRLALICGALAWLSLAATYLIGPHAHPLVGLLFPNAAMALILAGVLAFLAAVVWERRWGAPLIVAAFLILPPFALYAVGLGALVLYGGV